MSGLLGSLGVVPVTSPWLPVPLMLLGLVPASAFAQAPQATTMSTLEREISAPPPARARRARQLRDRQGNGRARLRARRTAAGRRDRAAAGVPRTAHADRRRLHHGPQAPQRGHRAQEGRGPRPARQPRAAAAGAGLHRDETRRLGAARARTPRPGRARQRDLPRYWLARLDYDGGQYASAIAPPAGTSWHRRRRLPARTTIWVSATKRSIRQTRRSRTTARPCGSIACDKEAPSAWPALNLGILLRTRGEMEEAEALFREALTHDRHFAPGLLSARRGPGAAWTHGRGGEGVAAGHLGRRRRMPRRTMRCRACTGGRAAPPKPTRRWPHSSSCTTPGGSRRGEDRCASDRCR